MKKFTIWKALARGVVLESLRRKDLWVVAILGFVILIASGAIGFFGFDGLQSFAKDLAATVLGGFSTTIAIITTARLMPDEIKNRTLYPLLSRPITRLDLLIGKLTGAICVSFLAFGLLAILTALALAMFRVTFEPVMLQYVLFKLLGLVIVCSFTMALSLWMTHSAAATLSFVLLFGSNMIIQALVLSSATADANQRLLFKLINGILPQVGLFDLGSRVANSNWGAVPIWVGFSLFLYMVAYSSAMLGLGYSKFRHKAI